ncbi:YdcF family protein [Patescibacteria group bacterium]|nr:YdcF family protein [Patescibacteria group bacterium]MBU4512585.1 YdcF family protein [Patescibacteria group bacterium]MCG2693357.1 YdcF family protein [Candidatus Parcubacteria bacterium]
MKPKHKFLKVFVIAVMLTIGGFIGLLISIYYHSGIDNAKEADAIVVLGASQWNGTPSPVLKARLDQAYLLYQKGYAPNIILTGGIGREENISESQVGKNYLIKKGLREEAILIEEKAHTSWQSLNQVAQIVQTNNFDSIILVSDGFHLMRLKKMAKDLNLKAFAFPVQESPIAQNKLEKFKYVIREGVVLIMYLLFKV